MLGYQVFKSTKVAELGYNVAVLGLKVAIMGFIVAIMGGKVAVLGECRMMPIFLSHFCYLSCKKTYFWLNSEHITPFLLPLK